MDRQPRVLVLSNQPPVPVIRGDRNRLFHVLQLLAETADVHLAYFGRNWEPSSGSRPRVESALKHIQCAALPIDRGAVMRQTIQSVLRGRPHIAYRFDSSATRAFLRGQAQQVQPDVVWAFQISMAPFLDELSGRAVVDIVDSPSRYVHVASRSDVLPWTSRLVARMNWRVSEFESMVAARADTVLVNSEPDANHLKRLAPSANVRILPNCVPAALLERAWRPDPHRPPRLLTVGHFDYPPYRAAMFHFISHVFPLIRRRLRDVELIVAGSGSHRIARSAEGQPGVVLLGYVDDIHALYESATALVTPDTVVMGLQYKVAEAMAIGLPVVGSSTITTASPLINREHVLVGTTDDEIAECAVQVATDATLAGQLSRNAKELVARRYTWEGQRSLIGQILSGVSSV
jgi:glycosyltransferase involved in cell wall biosynthesis